jgi:LPS-assembly protein
VPRSQRGFMVGLGYFWAINRSYDVTYRFQDYNTNAFGHHLDFRGKPRAGTDFDFILYGVQDRGGDPNNNNQKFSGLNLYFAGRSDVGNGWHANGYMNYVSSFRFRQEWSESFNEAIGSEIHSEGYLEKNWSNYTFDLVASRLENFQSVEVQEPGQTNFTRNAVLIHKLPEGQLAGRERRILRNVPIWFSFYSTAGLLYRSQPIFDAGNNLIDNFQTAQFNMRAHLAPHVTSALHFGGISLVPSMGLDETYYAQSQAPSAAAPNLYQVASSDVVRSARDFSLDVILPSVARIFNKKTIFGDKLKHVIEPRVTYRYVTGVGDDFNRFIRFDETDLLANTNELELSLANRIFAKRGDSVTEIFTWELMQKRYFDPTFGGALVQGRPDVFTATADLSAYAFALGPRHYSPIVSMLRASPVEGLGFNWQADYDPFYHRIVDSNISIDYNWKKYYHVSAGNSAVSTDPLLTPAANQFRARVGFGDPQHRGWNAGVDAVYDYRKAVLEYSTTQVTYNTDCCGFSVQYRRYNIGVRDESRLTIAFAIANVGTFGTLKKQDRLF